MTKKPTEKTSVNSSILDLDEQLKFVLSNAVNYNGRGRDTGHPAPPAQIRDVRY